MKSFSSQPLIASLLFLLAFSLPLAAENVIHMPYETGDCTLCHTDAKATDGKLTMDAPELCYQCHAPKDDKKFVHGPVQAGLCTTCHNPHESPNKRLLSFEKINDLCTMCHVDKGEFLQNTPNIHPPVQESCINCHDPHTSDFKFQLKAEPRKDLCLGCHTEKKEWIEKVKNKHGAIDRENRCIGCHDPHGSGHPKFLRKDTAKDLCLMCHNGPIRRLEDNVLMTNIGKHLEDNPDWHGPILWGDCAACHNPHGSDNYRMLKKPFPQKSTQKFDKDNYICFQCHEPKKIQDQFTNEFTEFRNKDKNLHFVHVNAKMISCKTCHDYHGSKDLPHHLRTQSQFGTAKFSLRYIEQPDGGSCDPICHARRHYDRTGDPKLR